jgi:lysophospholipase L1-like esterase
MYRNQRHRRQRYRRRKSKQIVIASVFLVGMLGVSIMEAAHTKEKTEHKNLTEIKKIETVTFNGFGDYKPQNKDEMWNNNTNQENVGKNDQENEQNTAEDTEQITEQENVQDNFSDAVFIGDSRTEGLQINTGLTTARFLAAKGLKVDTALTENVIKLKNGSKGTIIDGLKEGTYKRVYIMFGMNELGWPYLDVFTQRYEKLITEVKKIQPNATIYVQSILPVTKEKSDKDAIYNNKNVIKFNKAIKEMADKNGYTYLDVSSSITDGNSCLPSDSSSDGIHLNKEYSQKWLNYLKSVK